MILKHLKNKLLIIFFLLNINIYCNDIIKEPFTIDGIRIMGMGKTGIACINDEEAAFYNPARLHYIPRVRLRFLDIRQSFDNQLLQGGLLAWNSYPFIIETMSNSSDTTASQDSTQEMLGILTDPEIKGKISGIIRFLRGFHPLIQTELPLFTISGKHWVFGTLTKVKQTIEYKKGDALPMFGMPIGFQDGLSTEILLDNGLYLGIGGKIYKGLSAGFRINYFWRFTIDSTVTLQTGIDLINGGNADTDNQSSSNGVLSDYEQYFNMVNINSAEGWSGSLGFSYEYKDQWSFGLNVDDLYSQLKIKEITYDDINNYMNSPDSIVFPFQYPSNNIQRIRPRISIGTTYYPKIPKWFLRRYGKMFGPNDIKINLDIRDILKWEDPLKKIYWGGELELYKTFFFRWGFAQGYLSFGGGVDVNILWIDYAFIGQELGGLAGQNGRYMHMIRVGIGL